MYSFPEIQSDIYVTPACVCVPVQMQDVLCTSNTGSLEDLTVEDFDWSE